MPAIFVVVVLSINIKVIMNIEEQPVLMVSQASCWRLHLFPVLSTSSLGTRLYAAASEGSSALPTPIRPSVLDQNKLDVTHMAPTLSHDLGQPPLHLSLLCFHLVPVRLSWRAVLISTQRCGGCKCRSRKYRSQTRARSPCGEHSVESL